MVLGEQLVGIAVQPAFVGVQVVSRATFSLTILATVRLGDGDVEGAGVAATLDKADDGALVAGPRFPALGVGPVAALRGNLSSLDLAVIGLVASTTCLAAHGGSKPPARMASRMRCAMNQAFIGDAERAVELVGVTPFLDDAIR